MKIQSPIFCMQIVGERLRALREAMKMTQSQVGELHGVPQALKIKEEQRKEMEQFVEMCFDPKSDASKRIKELMLQMMEEKKK